MASKLVLLSAWSLLLPLAGSRIGGVSEEASINTKGCCWRTMKSRAMKWETFEAVVATHRRIVATGCTYCRVK